jgi:hypothetical protein
VSEGVEVWVALQKASPTPCVLNGVRSDGSLTPLLVTCIRITGAMHALLFECIDGAVITLDVAGMILSANCAAALLLAAQDGRQLCGRALTSLCVEPGADPIKWSLFKGGQASRGGGAVDVVLHGVASDKHIACVLRVLELRNMLCVITLHSKDNAPDTEHELVGPYAVLPAVLGLGMRWGLHRPTGIEVAVKRLSCGLDSGGLDLAMHYVKHPNIVRLYDVVVSAAQDVVHVVLEYVAGGTLLQHIKARGVSCLGWFLV